jgi:methyl-accepting chemotaxis protein
MDLRERLFSGILSKIIIVLVVFTIAYFIILRSVVVLDKRTLGLLTITILIYGIASLGLISIFVEIPLVRLLNKAERVRFKADLTVDFSSQGGDEIAHLSRAFQRVMEYFHEMAEASRQLAQGNLKVEVKPRSEKDIFAHSFQEMVYNLRSLVEEIRSGASKVAEASKSFTSVTDQSTATMSQLAGSVSQISKAATQVSQAAQTASLAAQQTLTSANTGKDTLEKAVSKMSVIRSTADSTAQVIEELGEHSGQVGDIVKVITRIADQTNLLSLNAAIEAARAGEAGRGFAVVADEVRKLAEDSANSAAKISQLVGEIQEKTVKAVEMTNQTTKEVKEGVIITSESEKKFFEIVQAAQNIANQIESIAAAAEETAASTEESSAASEEQAAGIEELSASAQNLLHTAQQLDELVSRFHIS